MRDAKCKDIISTGSYAFDPPAMIFSNCKCSVPLKTYNCTQIHYKTKNKCLI